MDTGWAARSGQKPHHRRPGLQPAAAQTQLDERLRINTETPGNRGLSQEVDYGTVARQHDGNSKRVTEPEREAHEPTSRPQRSRKVSKPVSGIVMQALAPPNPFIVHIRMIWTVS